MLEFTQTVKCHNTYTCSSTDIVKTQTETHIYSVSALGAHAFATNSTQTTL